MSTDTHAQDYLIRPNVKSQTFTFISYIDTIFAFSVTAGIKTLYKAELYSLQLGFYDQYKCTEDKKSSLIFAQIRKIDPVIGERPCLARPALFFKKFCSVILGDFNLC